METPLIVGKAMADFHRPSLAGQVQSFASGGFRVAYCPMRLLRVILITAFAIATCSIAGFVALLPLGGNSMCANEVLAAVASPDTKLKAVVFQRDCGATTGFSTQVAVLPANERLRNEPGNVFVADTDHGAAPFGRGGGSEVAVHWLSDVKLQIGHDPSARVFLAEHRVGHVQIDYRR